MDANPADGIQRLLDENVGIIRTIEEYRIKGVPDDEAAVLLKRTLHRNLMHLAALAEEKEGVDLDGIDALKYELIRHGMST